MREQCSTVHEQRWLSHKVEMYEKKKRGRKRKTHESKHIQLDLKAGPAQQILGLKTKILYRAFLYVNIN